MSNVIPFVQPDTVTQWLSGPARCPMCKHTWAAVVPVGTEWLECPSCGSSKGQYSHPVLYPESLFACNCGCDTFRISARGTYCINCGAVQRF